MQSVAMGQISRSIERISSFRMQPQQISGTTFTEAKCPSCNQGNSVIVWSKQKALNLTSTETNHENHSLDSFSTTTTTLLPLCQFSDTNNNTSSKNVYRQACNSSKI